MSKEKRAIKAEDLYEIKLITTADLSHDGRHIVYSLQWVDSKSEKKHSNLWITSTDDGSTRQFTCGDHTDSQPKWSPDGSRIAFLSNRDNEKQAQIYLIPFGGGEAQPKTNLHGDFETFEWSPEGTHLVMQFRKTDQETIDREKDKKKKELGVVCRQVDRLFYKFDGVGYLPRERWHIWTLNVNNGETRQLTNGMVHDERFPTWSPDGKWIAFISNRTPNPDANYHADDLFIIPPSGGVMHLIETPEGPKQYPCFSPDGKWLAYIGKEGLREWWRNNNLWIIPTDGSSPAHNLTGKYDIDVSLTTLNDVIGAINIQAPTWSPDCGSLFFQVSQHGNSYLMSVSTTGEDLKHIIEKDGTVGWFGFSRDLNKLAYYFGDITDPGQIFFRNQGENEDTQLTRNNLDLFTEIAFGEIEEIWFNGHDGYSLQGWIINPPGFDPQKTYPSVLEIHGGPLAQYGNLFMHEFYYLASKGYVVYFCNPRGGQGYGEEHAKSIWGGWGDTDYNDLMTWVDHLSDQAYIDSNKMGVTGGSYGGYMTLWIIGHTQRFKVAVAQRVVSNFTSMWGSSDLNWVFQQVHSDKPPWEDFEKLWHHSPIAHIGNAKTPTMIIHSELDHRCPIEQGEQAFVALKRLGVNTQMLRFPDEPHGLSRNGRTDRRVARLEHITNWFDRYLKD
ncbi:MAG: S9 family peptidase [Anaerolineales bacterium]|jgi:dipeptidyl aminopeptidase/acylaminoacyl peptidase